MTTAMELIHSSYQAHANTAHACCTPHPTVRVFKRKRTNSQGQPTLLDKGTKRQCLDGLPQPATPLYIACAPVQQAQATAAPCTTAPQAQPPASAAPVDCALPDAPTVSKLVATPSPAPEQSTVTAGTGPSEPTPSSTPKVNLGKLDRARQKIESTINYEILVRHDELRLIDQEIAKCQVALEQIRRCKQIPFPGLPGAAATPYQASTGEVGALEPAPGFTRPLQPAGFGITDGPYSRHYAHWLIPDARFDSILADSLPSMAATRSFDRSPFSSSSSSRSGRHSLSLHQSLPSNFPVPKAQPGPLVIKRLSDGKMVKLVCVWCQKENVSSVQGFLNHCRIAHGEGFASHEQAAQRCGQPVDEAQLPTTTPAAPATTPSTPVVQTPGAPTPGLQTPSVGASSASSTLVHPLNTTKEQGPEHPAASLIDTATSMSTSTSPAQTCSRKPQHLAINIPQGAKSGFVPSQSAPHLSSLFKKAGMNMDLSKLVAEAKIKCNVDDITPLHEDEDESPCKKPESQQAPVARTVAGQQSKTVGGGLASNKFRLPQPHTAIESTSSSVASTPTTYVARPANVTLDSQRSPGSPTDVNLTNSPEFGLSPHADHNPGLMTDNEEDGDFETPSEVSDSEEHHSEAQRALQVQVRNHGDLLHDHVVRGSEEAETPTLPCEFAQPKPAADHNPDAPKRKRGRPSKASQGKVKGG